MKVIVGICGFAEAQARVFGDFELLEVQQSFYQPPQINTAARWYKHAPAGFIFTVKAWQLITHTRRSPTYRRLRESLSDADLDRAGDFQLNNITRMAWERTQAIADALHAPAVVFQTPRSFQPTQANLRQLRRFFEAVDRRGRRLVFEPRGEAWDDRLTGELVRDLDLIHAVDPFLRRPVGRGLRYFRLHGLPAYNYRYRYSDADLDNLVGRLNRAWPNYVLFNNDSMAEDARRLLRRLRA